MSMRTVIAFFVVGTLALGVTARAQMGGMKMPAQMPIGSAQSPAAALDQPLGLLEMEMMGVAKAMPADKYGFAPSHNTFAAEQGAKFDGVRTFAEEVSHVTQANYLFYQTVSGLKPDADVKAIASMSTKDELVNALAKSFAYAHKAVATITLANGFVTIKGVDGMQTRVAVAAFAVAHAYDHYGQMVEYLRMNGVVPPGSK